MLFTSLLFAAATSVALASPKGGQCYDCNYAPDGIVKNSNGTWAATKNDVFHHCALASSDNANYINKRNCISGRCFVRKDDNGMVFRGCADQWNLPWGIDTSKSCEQQSYQGSVWWFCDGDLCNNVDIEAECGSVPVRSGSEDPPVVTNLEIAQGFDPDHEVSMGDADGGVLYAHPAELPQPGYETVHGQEYAYWKDPPKRKRRPINRKSDGYQTRQTETQDDVYYSRISGQPMVAEPVPEVYLPVPQPENPVVVAYEEPPVITAPEPEPEHVARPAYEAGPNYWWNYFPFNYHNHQRSMYPYYGYQNNQQYQKPSKASYASAKPKQEEPKPANTYRPNPKRTEVNILPAQSSAGSWSQGTSYRAPETSYRAPQTSYRAAETSYRAPKVVYQKPQAVYKIEYETPSYVAPEPAPPVPEQPAEYHSHQTNDDPSRRDYYADRHQTDMGYDRPYVYFAERNDPYGPADERGQTRLDTRVGARCYECNFAPSGYVAIPHGPPRGGFKEVGYMKCGLQTEADRLMVDQWTCPSSTCFIRRDPNGMVYRGCADRENLPFNVRPGSDCRYEGKNNALWYFCHGDLCNDGQLGEDAAHCGSTPPPAPQPPPQPALQPVPNPPQPVQPKQTYSVAPASSHLYQTVMFYPGSSYHSAQYPRMVDTYDFQADNAAVSYPAVVHDYTYQTNYQVKQKPKYHQEYEPVPEPEYTVAEYKPPVYSPPQIKHSPPLYEYDYPPVPPPMPMPEYAPLPEYAPPMPYHMGFDYPPKPEYQAHQEYLPKPEYEPAPPEPEYQPQPEYPVMQYSPPATSTHYSSSYNPCTGNCRENPSGLFADPSRSSHFIQCGCDIVMGTPCTCCKPYYMACPDTMAFDDKIKVCVHV